MTNFRKFQKYSLFFSRQKECLFQKLAYFDDFPRRSSVFHQRFLLKKVPQNHNIFWFLAKNSQILHIFKTSFEITYKSYQNTSLVQILGDLGLFFVIYHYFCWFLALFFLRKVRPNCSDQLRWLLASTSIAQKPLKSHHRW